MEMHRKETENTLKWEKMSRHPRLGKIEKKHGQIKIKQFGKDSFSLGKDTVELKYVEQITDGEQTAALSYALKNVIDKMETGNKKSLEELAEELWSEMEKKGLVSLVKGSYVPVSLAMARKQELYACLNRYRGFH